MLAYHSDVLYYQQIYKARSFITFLAVKYGDLSVKYRVKYQIDIFH